MGSVESCKSCRINVLFSYLPLGRRVDTVTGENKIWVLSSFVSCFFRSLTCPGLESLGHRVDTVTGENKMWVLSSLVVYFFPSVACRVLWCILSFCCLPCLGHRVVTVKRENKIWRLSSPAGPASYFCSSVMYAMAEEPLSFF